MKRSILFLGIFTLAATLLSGTPANAADPKAGEAALAKDTHAAVTKDIIKELDAVVAATDSAKDATSAAAAKVKLEASAAALKAIVPRMNKLGKPDQAAQETMKADAEKLFTMLMKMDDVDKRLKADPALKPALDGFNKVGEAMKAVMNIGN